MLKVNIIGQDSLAAATKECCARHFIVDSPNPDILWVCYDTPIGLDDKPDSEWVIQQIKANLPAKGVLVLVSSQMPVGTTERLEKECPGWMFACSPENIRVATAVADFTRQERIVVGRRTEQHDWLFSQLFAPFTDNLILTDPETAEMVKHALNCWLGLNIAFINEIARIAKVVGADSGIISKALLTERRVGGKAPLRPGSPFGGGHLARDIYTLSQIAAEKRLCTPIVSNIRESNSQK